MSLGLVNELHASRNLSEGGLGELLRVNMKFVLSESVSQKKGARLVVVGSSSFYFLFPRIMRSRDNVGPYGLGHRPDGRCSHDLLARRRPQPRGRNLTIT